MRLTLKKLLDYRDDRLSPVETRELGKILAENAEACKWLDQLDKALWESPPIESAGTAEPIATIARYLDNRLDSAAESELEKRALLNPALLLEIARCHQLVFTPQPKVRRVNPDGVENSDGSLLEWSEGQLDLEDLTLDNLAALSEEKPERIIPDYENPLEILGEHFQAKTEVPKTLSPEDGDAIGAIWRLALIGFCFVGLSGLMGNWNGPEGKANATLAFENSMEAMGTKKTKNQLDIEKGVGLNPIVSLNLDQNRVNFPNQANRDLAQKMFPQTFEKEKETTPSTVLGAKGSPFPSPPAKVEKQAGQVTILGLEGTILDGHPGLVWTKGQYHERRLPGDSVSWGRDIFIPPGFVAGLDPKTGCKVFGIGLCPTTSGAEKPLGTKLRFEPGPMPDKPVLHLEEGQVEIHFDFVPETRKQPGGYLLHLNGQLVSLNPGAKSKVVVEVMPRPANSKRPDWEIHILEGMVEFQAADGQSAVNMFATPGVCVARHSFSGGISLEKRGTTPAGFGVLWWKSLPRSKEFAAAAGEILSFSGTNWNSPKKIQGILSQPSGNLARKVLCVQLVCWLGAPELAIQQVGDPRASMKELRAAALAGLAQTSRRDPNSWSRLFDPSAKGSLLPADLESFGETMVFRQLVESLGRGESLPAFVNHSLLLLAEGKSLWVREVAYGYLLEAIRPALGPRFDPAGTDKARQGSQVLWARLFANAG